jgi:arachidonate 5-lipoxygenase
MYVFPIFRWVRPDWHYVIRHLDTSLPQFDEYREQRKKELDEKKKTYVFAQKAPGMPVQVGWMDGWMDRWMGWMDGGREE